MNNSTPTFFAPWEGEGWYWFLAFQFLFWLSTRFGVPTRYFFKWNSFLFLIFIPPACAIFYSFLFLTGVGHFFDLPRGHWALWYIGLPFFILILPIMFYYTVKTLKFYGRWPI